MHEPKIPRKSLVVDSSGGTQACLMLEVRNGFDALSDDRAAVRRAIRTPLGDRDALRRMGLESISTATEEVTLDGVIGTFGPAFHMARERCADDRDGVVHPSAPPGPRSRRVPVVAHAAGPRLLTDQSGSGAARHGDD